MRAYMQQEEVKIPDMTMDQIKEYLCRKYQGKPEACRDCKGRDTCSAGKRAIELLDSAKTETENGADKKLSSSDAKRAKAREVCTLVLEEADPMQAYIDLTGANVRAMRERFRTWQMKYPDLFVEAGWDHEKLLAAHRENPNKNDAGGAKSEVPVMEKVEPKTPEEDADEVDILSFLGQIPIEENVQETVNIIETPKESPADETDKAAWLRGEMNSKYEQLRIEKERCQEEIRKLEERIRWCEEQQEALVKVTALLDPSTAIAKSLVSA